MDQKEQTKCMDSDGMQKMNGVINADLITVEERHRKLLQNFAGGMEQNKCERVKKMQVVIEIPKEVLYDAKQTIEQTIHRLFRRNGVFGWEIEKN